MLSRVMKFVTSRYLPYCILIHLQGYYALPEVLHLDKSWRTESGFQYLSDSSKTSPSKVNRSFLFWEMRILDTTPLYKIPHKLCSTVCNPRAKSSTSPELRDTKVSTDTLTGIAAPAAFRVG
jgi:hypothetical protein